MNKYPRQAHHTTQSNGEAMFAFHVHAAQLPRPHEEYKFLPSRRFRFDFAWPTVKLAVEIEGGSWSGGRHTRGAGFEADCEKYALAAINGWRVIRVTTGQVQSGKALEWVQAALSTDCLP